MITLDSITKTSEGKKTVKYVENKSIKTVPEKHQEAVILDKDFILKMLKVLKEDVKKVKKVM